MVDFDPNAAAAPEAGIFGLDHDPLSARVVLIPVPFAATVSYGGGAEHGPAAILRASHQIDLYDLQTGKPYEQGIAMLPADPKVSAAHARARPLAQSLIARGGAGAGDAETVAAVDAAGQLVEDHTWRQARAVLERGAIPGIVGGDHSVAQGAIRAAAEKHAGLGILHVDAHADLRPAFEGFRYSHASIMHNVLHAEPAVGRIVQVGIRDFSEGELRAIQQSEGRVVTHFDQEWARHRYLGESFASQCRNAVEALPEHVWISFDIDGLDPALCPGTGTPVPGGLQFAEAVHLLHTLVGSGRHVVGFDLCEVTPASPGSGSHGSGEWDANVGARLLYKLCGFALLCS